jgi:hypothetical protein
MCKGPEAQGDLSHSETCEQFHRIRDEETIGRERHAGAQANCTSKAQHRRDHCF